MQKGTCMIRYVLVVLYFPFSKHIPVSVAAQGANVRVILAEFGYPVLREFFSGITTLFYLSLSRIIFQAEYMVTKDCIVEIVQVL